jgi:hypothetical protein
MGMLMQPAGHPWTSGYARECLATGRQDLRPPGLEKRPADRYTRTEVLGCSSAVLSGVIVCVWLGPACLASGDTVFMLRATGLLFILVSVMLGQIVGIWVRIKSSLRSRSQR